VDTGDVGQYTVTLTNSAGSITSAPWTLSLGAPTVLTVTLNSGDSFDFLTRTKAANPWAGDLYFAGNAGLFQADHLGQRGVLSLGNVPTALKDVIAPFGFYSRYGTQATVGSTYVSWLHSGAAGEFAAFKVTAVTPSSVTLQYFVTTSVDQPLSIRMQPSPFSSSYPMPPGSFVQLDVGAIGTGPLRYQWRKNGNPISGATDSSLILQNISTLDNGSYDVVVTNPTASVNSQPATVNVPAAATPPTIIGNPLPATTTVGGFAGFSVAVAGTTPWSFQWRKNGIPIPLATAPFYFVVGAKISDAGDYDVVVSNIAGSVISRPAHLTVNKAHASIMLSNLVQSYDGAPKAVSVTTSPAGLSCSVTYNGSTTAPTAVGTYAVVATITDPNYDGTATATLVIRDTTPPVIASIQTTPDTIEQPNHKMIPVVLSVAVTDNADPQPVTRIVSVSSSEPANATGDGDTEVDWEITGDLTLNVRGERSGTGSGRVYSIVIESRDASGNVSTATTTVTVLKGR
jgi:hypothetical protein